MKTRIPCIRGAVLLRALSVGCILALFTGSATADHIGDAKRGENLFSKCKGCHQVGEGAKDRVGPQLNGKFGRAAASVKGNYRYSKGMTRAGAGGLIWELQTLESFMEKPKALVSGTRMSFRGMKKHQDRMDVLAYLRLFSEDPANIPEASPTALPPEVVLPPEILALVGDPEYGEYLANEYTSCHQRDGGDDGIPSITRWPVEDSIIALHAYKTKVRSHPVMQMMAGRLTDEEIAALAAYFKDLE